MKNSTHIRVKGITQLKVNRYKILSGAKSADDVINRLFAIVEKQADLKK